MAPVHIAAENDNRETIVALRDLGANLLSKNKQRHLSAAGLAAEAGHLEVLKLLNELTNGSIFDTDPLAVTAALNGHVEVVQYLADCNATKTKGAGGWTALFAAAWAGHADMVHALGSVDPTALSVLTANEHLDVPPGTSPRGIAESKGHVLVLEAIRALEASAVVTSKPRPIPEGECFE